MVAPYGYGVTGGLGLKLGPEHGSLKGNVLALVPSCGNPASSKLSPDRGLSRRAFPSGTAESIEARLIFGQVLY